MEGHQRGISRTLGVTAEHRWMTITASAPAAAAAAAAAVAGYHRLTVTCSTERDAAG